MIGKKLLELRVWRGLIEPIQICKLEQLKFSDLQDMSGLRDLHLILIFSILIRTKTRIKTLSWIIGACPPHGWQDEQQQFRVQAHVVLGVVGFVRGSICNLGKRTKVKNEGAWRERG